jgi:2-keto-4-pentenoate hydratase/2-oxohepta-3-ene-1,7-dioic acid hydratase in catechol pathway
VEIGLVIGRGIPVGTKITESNLSDYLAGLVVTNDVSARDIQLTKTQFYQAKSYPTFTPVSPALVMSNADELKRFGDLRLELRVGGEVRQNMFVHGDMIFKPVQALQSLSRFQRHDAGVAGYDTKRLFIGSHDDFGTISTAIFKITVDGHNEAPVRP